MVGPDRADIEGCVSLVPSLLQAIVRIDGEALVMHVGDKPYVVSPTGQVDLATRGLTFDAVSGIVNQLLPLESQRALDEFGAAQFELPPVPEFPGEHFTVVVARGGDDVWAEIRRRRVPDEDRVPMELFGTSRSEGGGRASGRSHIGDPTSGRDTVRDPVAIPNSEVGLHAAGPAEETDPTISGCLTPRSSGRVRARRRAKTARPTSRNRRRARRSSVWLRRIFARRSSSTCPASAARSSMTADAGRAVTVASEPDCATRVPAQPARKAGASFAAVSDGRAVAGRERSSRSEPVAHPSLRLPAQHATPARRRQRRRAAVGRGPHAVPPAPDGLGWHRVWLPPAPRSRHSPSVRLPSPARYSPQGRGHSCRCRRHSRPHRRKNSVPPAETFAHSAPAPSPFAPQPQPAVVLPMARNPIRSDVPPPLAEQALAGLDRLLRLAAARGASTLYLSSASRPSVRVDGEVQTLDGAPSSRTERCRIAPPDADAGAQRRGAADWRRPANGSAICRTSDASGA